MPTLRELYHALKADGAPLPDTYEGFENYMTSGEQKGYAHRKQVYDALKADGAPLPDTYEEFSKALFHPNGAKPAPATSGTAPKQQAQQDTPLTEADKTRMMAQTGAIMRNAKQNTADFNDRMNNMKEYGLGLNHGQAKHGKTRFNAQTGKMEKTYLTPAGNRYSSKTAADMESFRYREAADMSVGGQLRHAEEEASRLEELMRKRKAEIDAENAKHPASSFLRGMADESHGMPGAIVNDNGMRDYRMDEQYRQLEAAARKNRQTIQLLNDKRDGNMNSFWHSLGTALGNGYTFSDGISDMNDAIAIMDALKRIATINEKHSAGKDLTAEELAAEAVLRNTLIDDVTQRQYAGGYGAWSRAGSTFAGSMDFMKDIVLTPGAPGVAKGVASNISKGIVKGIGKIGGKMAAESIAARAFAKATGILVGAHTAGAVVSNTAGIGHTAGEFANELTGDVDTDENAVYSVTDGKGLMEAFLAAERNQIRENGSEMFGELMPGAGRVLIKGMEKVGLKKLSGCIQNIGKKDWYKQYSTLLRSGGYNGLPGEGIEEYEGYLFDMLTGHGSDAVKELGNLNTHIDIWLGCATTGAILGAVPMTVQAGHTAMYYRYKHRSKLSDRAAASVFGAERWSVLRDRIDETPNEGMADIATAIFTETSNEKERTAAMSYIRDLTKMRGYNIAQMTADKTERPEIAVLNDCFRNGYEITSGRERNDAKNMLEYQRKRVAQSLSEEALQEIDDIGSDILDSDTDWNEEQRDAVEDYLNAKQVYEGMQQRYKDDVDAEVENSNAMIDARVNDNTGMIQGATMKQDDRKVYVVSGNLVTYPDGTGVDLRASDQSVIVRDAETGDKEQVAPDAILRIDEAIDPNQAKEEAASAIMENAAKRFDDDINGAVVIGAGNTFDVVDEDGRQANVTITPNAEGVVDNGDGTVNVSMDGKNVVPVPVEVLQEMVDAANMARVAQFEQERTINNAQVREEEREAARPQYALNDEVTLRDENGNAIRGSIVSDVDADGIYEVYTEDPINGARVNLFSRDELDGMLVEHNGEAIEQPVIALESAEVAESTETDNNGTKNIPENGNIVEENIPTAPQPTALERIPKDKQGQPIYEQTDSDTAWDAIVEQSDGDEGTAQSVADDMLADKEAELKKLEKAKSKGGVTIADKIAAEKERKAAISAAQDVVSVWKKIAGTAQRRKSEADAIRRKEAEEQAAIRRAEEEKLRAEREETERIEREALNGVPDMVDDKPQDARARGYRRVTGTKVDRQQPLGAKKGKNVQVRFSDSDIADGSVALIDADQLQPSHVGGVRNPLHFIDEAQPKERNDDASKLSSRKMASNMRPEEITSSVTAYTGAPTVNSRGEVIQGNNRSDALRQMWQGEPEQAAKYKQYLTDHSEEFGLNPADIEAMERPVLVNMLDVDDNKAIELGQFVAQDTESGGTERIKPKNAVQKIGTDMGTFANLLLRSSDDETSFSGLVDANGVDVLKWMSAKGYITPTQYQSAFDSKGNLTAEAKNDLRGIMYQSIFKGGSTRLEEMFNVLPAKAQKAILATAYRDYESPNAERMVEEIQNSIRAFYALMQDATFVEAKNYKDVRLAIEGWKRQYQMDDVTGESYLPAENFSNFALNLAALYKGESQSLIQATFNKMFDLIQGTQEETLFEKPDNTPRSLIQAIKETLNIDYNGQQRSNVLADDSAASQKEQGSTGVSETGEQNENGNGAADRSGGIGGSRGRSGIEGTDRGNQEKKDNETQDVIGHSMTADEAQDFIADMELIADTAPEIELTIENWDALFGEDGVVSTPIGDVKMGENQFTKLMRQGRNGKLGMVKPTLEHPHVIIEDASEAKDGNATERASSYVFIRSFRKADGSRYYYFTSITVSKDGKEVVVSNQEKRRNAIANLLVKGKLVWKHADDVSDASDVAQGLYSSQGNVSDLATEGTDAPQTNDVKKEAAEPNDGGTQTEQRPADVSVTASPDISQGISTDKGTENPRKTSELGEKIAEAEAKTDKNPTEAQKEAGNYKKGHVQIGAFDITIENPKGSVRSGVDAKGNKWETEMHNTYGYIRGTEGVDGDHIDVFLADDIDGWNGRKVYVIDQYNEDGTFDEHKVMLGFNTAEEAHAAYLSNYEAGWQNTHKVVGTPVNIEDFEKWINSSHRKTKAFAEYSNVKKQQDSEQKQNLSKFNVGDVVRDYYTNRLYRIKKFTKTGLCTIAELDSNGNEARPTTFNADNNPRFGADEAPVTTAKEEKQEEPAVAKVDMESLFDAMNTKDEAKLSDHATPIEETDKTSTDGYTVEPAQYTTKRGKVLDMQLVKFDRELSKEEARNAKALAKIMKGWFDKETGGFMMRTAEDAQRLADAIMDESGETLEDAAPLSLTDVKEVSGTNITAEAKEAPTEKQEAPADDTHKLVTNERYEQLKKRMLAKMNQLNMGIDPEMLAIGTEMAVYHIEGGARKFAQYAKAMIEDMGDAIRPYLKSFYNAVRDLPEAQDLASSMDTYDDVSNFDVANFDKASTNALATAEMVVAESEVEEQATEAKEAITNQRNTKRRQKNEQTTADTETIARKSVYLQAKQPEVKPEQPTGDLFSGLFDTEITKKQDNNGKERSKDTSPNHSRAEFEREGLPSSEQVGAGASVQDTATDSEGKRRRYGISRGESGARPQYDVNKDYSNEDIHEIASSVAAIKDGKVVLTGEVTDDIKAICRQYKSGGVAKKGRGVLDEYYTDGKIVDAVRMLIEPYFTRKTVRILEPSVGIGNFADVWQGMSTSEIVAFEINETTARIAKILHPEMDVNLRSFETEFIDDSGNKKPLPEKFNLIVGNPPYGSHRGLYKGLGEESKIARYEDYFVKRSLDVLEDGGVLAMVLPSSWIDRHTKYGGYTVEVAYRLPSGAFESTQVGTDIVVLRKDSSVPVSEHAPYFGQHPENICGEVKQRKGRFGKQEDYVAGSIDAAVENIERENAKRLADKLGIEQTADNLNEIQSAIEETGNADKAAAIVKDAKTVKADNAPRAASPAKPGSKNGKYKVRLRKGTETVPTSQQFRHTFSDGEVEAFKDTSYDGTLDNPSQHGRYANYIDGRAVHDFYYAEGDIYSKLEQLEQDKESIVGTYGKEQYEKQKRLLESVLPKRKGISEIAISPNTTFVKNLRIHTPEGNATLRDMFLDFCRKLPRQAFGSSSSWEVTGYVENKQVYGQDKHRNQLVRERRKRVANDLFVKFLNEELSEAERSQVVHAFNREYNSTYRPDYSKVPMFSTINKDFKGRPLKLTSVQLAGVGRMTVKGVGVLAHEVGFGKTLSGVLAMHEAMTRGFAKKPLIVVPNDNILKQWVETIGEVLPQATVNTLGNLGASYDLTGFRVEDFEFTIVTYEGLKAMSFSDDTYDKLSDRFSYITDDLKKHQSERDAQKAIEKRKELKGKMKRGTKPTYGFEDFGFDYLTFDEVHNANHIVSKVRIDKSVASDFRSQSQRTSDLGMKTWLAAQYIQEMNDGRNVLLLSATPFTNKPLEYYSILSLVGNGMLRRKGFFNIDQFFSTFMEADNELEIGANGRPMQKTNVRKFRNNGLFQQLLSEFIDIKGEEDNPDLERPERHNREYRLRQNALTDEAIAAAQDLLSDNDTVLLGIGHARAAAFSPYATTLLGMRPKDHKEFVENSPKIEATVRMIEQNRKDRPDTGQIVYSEVGVEFFPLMRDYLVKESGFKPEEVRIITGATSNAERINIQTAFNKGDVKVVIGSPAIKEGLNLQENTTDMYILSLPWNFTQLRQIEGRGWRQGNRWNNIRINYMLTDDSVDVFMLQRLQTKQGLYNEAMKSGAESVDVGDLDTAELKTSLITDPAVRAEIVTMQERAKLEQEKTQVEADLAFINRKYQTYNELVSGAGGQRNLIERYKEYAKEGGGYWEGAAKEAERRLAATEQKIEQEKLKLFEKGINVDDIERQTEQAQKTIEAINGKIEHLKDFEQELAEKYRQESQTKERGDALPSYLNERKKENRSGFYSVRRKNDDVLTREGNGAYSDDALSYENDPIAKWTGKSSRSKAQRKAFAQRERQRMAERVNELAEKLGLDNVEVVTDTSTLEGKKQRAKGFFSKSTGKITTVIPNHVNVFDVEQTLLHEAVAHYGLRQLFGEHFDTFLDNVFNNADESVRREIVEMARKHGWDFRTATEEYLAGLAENTDFESTNAGWWNKIKSWFLDMLHKIGFEGFSGVTLTDNELRYILWRSYENLAEPGRYRSILGEAADVAKQHELKVGNYAESVTVTDDMVAETGMMEEVNKRFNEELERLTPETADKVTLWLGRPSAVLRAAGVEDRSMKLYGNKVIKKMKKHGFELGEIRDLPHAVANPIAVFNNLGREGNRSILTELKTEQGNFLVTIDLGKGEIDADFNIVSSVFGKNDAKIADWINKGLATYINKEKALNYLHHSAPIAEALSNPRLNSAAKVVKNFENPNIESKNVGEDDILFRDGDPETHERALARDRYEQRVKRGWYQTQESLQDSMLGLREAMDAILKADGKHINIEDVNGFENAYLGENRLSSVNKAEADAFAQLVFKPMLDEVAALAKTEAEREELTDYMMAKHGLERNVVMAEREYNKYLSETPNGTKTLDDFRERDYAGLTALTGMEDVADAEAEAQQMVADYESSHDTASLWDKVKAVNSAILSKQYECGLMSKETYEHIKSMYEYYIPLRGFDNKTSNEAYAYLDSKHSAFNAPIKKAHGRSSKADDPFANMQSMAESSIAQGNRNKLVKQRFLNFVLNHPSDLASVSDLWIQYDDIMDEWKPVFPDNIETTDTPDEVEQKMIDFNEKMEQLAANEPDKYKRGKDAVGIPYRVIESGDLRQHQIVVKRNGRDYIITINGNPRAAQAINGQTNPDNDMSGAIGAVLRAGEKINRQLSAFYTTRNPDFVVSNFMRDMLYTNSMVWIKENPNYALRFHKNVVLVNPAKMKSLLAKHREGTLNMNNTVEEMFYQFMMNGGETGYANIRDVEQHKNDIRRELKKANSKIPVKRAWDLLGERFDEYNRAVENCARFAAFITSRQFGRSIDRAIYDAKEISVNFNKKGSGAKFYDAVGQTRAGNVSSLISGLGRNGFVFWNAAIQGTTNFGRQAKRHPAKALTAVATVFILGALMAYLNGDDDDDDKNAYYNLPDHVRRSNLLFRAGEHWISLPLPQEYRAIYGMGELMSSVLSGKEHYTDGELAEKILGQMTQVLPLDIMEGGGGLGAFVPSSVKPLAEAYVMEKSWTGMPLYKNTPYNKDMPEWTKAYKSANKYIVGLSETLNEATGGDAYTKGTIDVNPAKVEYMLNGYFGGVFSTIDKMVKTGETFFGDREYDPRSVLLVNRLLKAGDERTEFRAINNEYFRLKNEHDIIKKRLKHYEDDTDNGVFDYAEKIDFLYNSPEYARYEIFEDYRKDIDDLYDELKESANDDEYKEVEAELNALKKEMILEMNETRNRK